VSLAVDLVTTLVGSFIWMNSPRNLRPLQAKHKKEKSTLNWNKSSARSRRSISSNVERTLTISDAKYYAKVFEKLKTDPQYPMNEKHRLEAIVAKGNVASEKYCPPVIAFLNSRLDNFKTRMNILSAFAISGKGTKHEEL